jgi:hypothetical protein
MQLQMIHPQDLDDPHLLRENRIMMLRYLVSGHALPVDGLMPGVLTTRLASRARSVPTRSSNSTAIVWTSD